MITKLQVKYIQSLGQKKFRDEEGVFVAEGPRIINELLAAIPAALTVLYATAQWLQTHGGTLKNIAADKLVEIKEKELERISFLQTPHEVLAVFKKPAASPLNFSQTLSLMLDGIQDPGNMGTIIRIADWFGIRNVICSMDCADAFAPKVIQSTMGSIVRVQLLYTGLVELVKKTGGLQLYATTLNGEKINDMQAIKEGVIVIGNESKGIHAALLDCCQQRITIPRIGYAESLNAAVATGIILSHITSPPAPLHG
ncbi:MAG: RNA methyltransferase, partial [Bacteroidota bacterium]